MIILDLPGFGVHHPSAFFARMIDWDVARFFFVVRRRLGHTGGIVSHPTVILGPIVAFGGSYGQWQSFSWVIAMRRGPGLPHHPTISVDHPMAIRV